MKYIKTYENIEEYNPGDIIIAKFELWDFNGKKQSHNFLLVIKKLHEYKFTNGNTYACYQYDDDIDDTIYVKKRNIIKKVSEKEAELLINANKYNV